MKKIEKISEGTHYAATTVGNLATLNEHTLVIAPGIELPGKVFVGNSVGATGAELSFQSFAVGAGSSFLHTHKTHEELYLFTRGSGEFQVDGTAFPVAEGSIVRVAPEGVRAVRNTGNEPLVMICIQYKADSFSADDAHDGTILNDAVIW